MKKVLTIVLTVLMVICLGACSNKTETVSEETSVSENTEPVKEENVESGETLGVIGGTGEGKSTLVNLISRLYDVDEGAVYVGGIDVRNYDMDALRNQQQRQQREQAHAGGIWDNKFNLVFTDDTGKYLVRRTVVKHFKKISQRANLSDDARFHDLRHSFAVTSLYAGDDIKTVQANLGHATAQFTLDVYGHVTQKMRQDSASRMQKFYEQLNTKNGQ